MYFRGGWHTRRLHHCQPPPTSFSFSFRQHPHASSSSVPFIVLSRLVAVSTYSSFTMSSVDELPGPSTSPSTFTEHRSQSPGNDDDNEMSDIQSRSPSRSVSPEPKRPAQANNKRQPIPFEYGACILFFSDYHTFSYSRTSNPAFARCFLDSSYRASSTPDVLPSRHPQTFRSAGLVSPFPSLQSPGGRRIVGLVCPAPRATIVAYLGQ